LAQGFERSYSLTNLEIDQFLSDFHPFLAEARQKKPYLAYQAWEPKDMNRIQLG
jgi:hypothetical protein